MKKLSLLLLAICVSLAGWAASLNPYAYNLSSTWNEATQELTVRFNLNAHPNVEENNSGKGIQIFAIDPSDNNKQYYIYGVPGDIIKAKMNKYNGGKGDSYDYELTIPITGVTWDGLDVLPAGKNLTWAVTVQGLKTANQSSPVVVNDNIANRPYSPHGIAVNNDQNSPDFGSIYVTECTDGVSGDATWNWLASSKGRSLLKYDPTLKYQTSYRKHKDGDATSELFSLRNGDNLLEPHRVRISDDGRIFVSSYNQNGSQTGKPAVWELQKTTGKYTEVITHNPSYGDRVVGMAVKGSGTGLKLLLCYWNLTTYVFKGYEYAWNGTAFVNATLKFTYTPSDQLKTGMGVVHNNKYYCFSDGFVNVAYGAKDNSTIWLGIDLFLNTNYVAYNTRLVHFNSSGNKLEDNTTVVSYGNGPDEYWYYGGAGFVPYVDQNTKTERIAMGRAKIGSGYHGRFCVFDINNSGAIASIPYKLKDGINTGAVVNDFAIDRAHNVYAVSFTDGTTANGKVSNGTTSNGTGRLVAIAMPYSGATMTMAPSTNADANRYFNVKPVPNILATDLRYEITERNEYVFSFNTNTTPEYAELRFYKSYDGMKQSLNTVNADNFKGDETAGRDNENLVCYYPITTGLTQGKITVTLGGVGGTIEDKRITNNRLPAGELYWSVYVKTRESNAFAPIYKQGNSGDDAHHRLHATINNYPETDGFGSLYVSNYHSYNNVNNSLMIYSFNGEGNSNDEQSQICNSTRYSLQAKHLNNSTGDVYLYNQRRLAVAPDGKVFITDAGEAPSAGQTNIAVHTHGGIKVWDPKNPILNNGRINLSLFSNNKINTSTDVAISNHNGGWKLYATNTYSEFTVHTGNNNYTNVNKDGIYGWNGFVQYNNLSFDQNTGLLSWTNTDYNNVDKKEYAFKRGDASGNMSLVAIEKGIWACQHREHNRAIKIALGESLSDNLDATLLIFFPYNATDKTYMSNNNSNGVVYTNKVASDADNISSLTQIAGAPLQSAPGAGMAYKKINGEEFLYVVNHEGNIVQLKIQWSGNIPSLTHVKTFVTPADTKTDQTVGSQVWHAAAISSMNFDYAGNLITTTGYSYMDNNFIQNEFAEEEGKQNIIVYTMPYDRTNAREIQAPNSCRMIPERLAYLDMSAQELELIINNHKDHNGCAIELFRPLQEGMFNTICLPFELNFANLPSDHPLKDADVRAFTGVSLETIGGEKVLSLVFSDITSGGDKVMTANVPYLLQPVADIAGSMRFDTPVKLTSIEGSTVGYDFDTDNRITFQGVIPITALEANPLTLLLVANNRLAELRSNTNILGFRGYFQLTKPLEPGTATRIVGKKPVATNTTIVVDGKKVNVEKFLREGRVYIRVGETLYTIDGVKVE